MSKILVIDRERFKEWLGYFGLAEPNGNFVEEDDIFKALEDSKVDVIEFKAEVQVASQLVLQLWLRPPQDLGLKDDEAIQVLVVKPKKPEVKDEKDKT